LIEPITQQITSTRWTYNPKFGQITGKGASGQIQKI